jgi:sugar lactone lactonase YvrE
VGTAITALTPSNSGGGAVASFGYSAATAFGTGYSGPSNLNVDASGNVYVPDYNNNTVREYTSAGTLVTATFGSGHNNPETIVADASGNIYVLNSGGNNITKFSSAGASLGTFASGFNSPYGMAIDSSGNIYVADYGNNRVKKYNSSGTLQLTITSNISGPSNVAIDASGNVFVLNLSARNVTKYNSSGTYQSTFKSGLSNTSFGFWVDGANNVYIGDSGNNKVTIYGPTGTTLTTITVTDPEGIVTDTKGNLYIASYSGNAVYKYTLTGGYFISPQLPPGLSFSNSTGVISGTPTTSFSPTTYTITAYNASGSGSTTISLECRQTLYWTGASNTNWATAGNWSTGVAPIANDDVEIGTHGYTRPREPSITAGNVTVRSITFGSVHSGTLTLKTNITLTINNNLTVNAGATGTITGGSATTSVVDMSPGAGVNIGSGALVLTSPLNFNLMSDATGDAYIGQITTGSISGTAASSVNVQRYLSGGSITNRGYRLLSSPVYNGTDTHSNKVYSINYLKDSIYLTATTTNGGFDNTSAANPTLYLYRESILNPTNATFTSGNFRGINNINSAPSYTLDVDGSGFYIPEGNGYLCFYRGNRANDIFTNETKTTYVPQPTTLSTSGTLNTGQVQAKLWYTPTSTSLSYTSAAPAAGRGFNLMGNPYASAINWDTFQTSSTTTGIYGTSGVVGSTIYVLDPVSKNFGTYTANSGGTGTLGASNIISSGQGFFVLVSNTGGQLFFNESAKTTSQNTGTNLLMGKPVSIANVQYLKLRMAKDSISKDETMIKFNNQASTNYNPNIDALYRQGYGAVSMSNISADNLNLAIHNLPLPKLQAQNIGLSVSANATGIYSISLKDIVSVPRLFDVWLMDNYKKDSLDMRQNITYQFYLDRADTSSFGSRRFTLVIRQNPAYAYRLLSFNATKVPEARQVQVVWNTTNEENYTNFTVERSTDNGTTFSVLGSVDATGAGKYSFIDQNPSLGTNLYRLKQEDINNTLSYSKIVTIQYANTNNNLAGNNLSIFPNPVSNNINLAISTQNNTASLYSIKFMSTSGRLVKEATTSQPSWQGTTENLQPGTYIIQVFDNKTQNLVGENKFVKL